VNPQRAAHAAVSRAVAAGRLVRRNACLVCLRGPTQFHHWSYLPEHRLDVVELCRSCHDRVHRGLMVEPLLGTYRTGPCQAQPPWHSDRVAMSFVVRFYPQIPPAMTADRHQFVVDLLDHAPVLWRAVAADRRRHPDLRALCTWINDGPVPTRQRSVYPSGCQPERAPTASQAAWGVA
jgi:hypothetical protein